MAGGAAVAPRLAFGVAGWSYPDWRDTVYRIPESAAAVQPDLFGAAASSPVKPRYVEDELAFLAGYVDMVEINSTFYRIPSPATAVNWSDRVRGVPGFFFTAKLNREFTHRFSRDATLAAQFRQALEPLRASGMLAAVLAQFRYDFTAAAANRSLVAWISGQFGDFRPLVVEVRHKSWEAADALEFLAERAISVVNLDYPTADDSFDLYSARTADMGYLRLHGRNRKAWFSRTDSPAEPYNYDYSDGEISELANRVEALLQGVRQLTIVANNHYRGKAVSAALRLKREVERQQVPIPPALLRTYPGLRD